jgi:hypothetical protein
LPIAARYALPLAAWMIVCIPRLMPLIFVPETTSMRIVNQVRRGLDRKHDLVVVTAQAVTPQFRYYLPRDIEIASYPDTEPSGICRWDTMMDHLREPARLFGIEERLKQVLSGGGKVWLIDGSRSKFPVPVPEERVIEEMPYFDLVTIRMEQVRQWLAANSVQIGSTTTAPGRDTTTFLSVHSAGK